PPDVVVIDLGLPGIDGLTTVARLREFCDARTLLVSGTTSGPEARAQVDGCATKPLRPSELVERVRELAARPPRAAYPPSRRRRPSAPARPAHARSRPPARPAPPPRPGRARSPGSGPPARRRRPSGSASEARAPRRVAPGRRRRRAPRRAA